MEARISAVMALGCSRARALAALRDCGGHAGKARTAIAKEFGIVDVRFERPEGDYSTSRPPHRPSARLRVALARVAPIVTRPPQTSSPFFPRSHKLARKTKSERCGRASAPRVRSTTPEGRAERFQGLLVQRLQARSRCHEHSAWTGLRSDQ